MDKALLNKLLSKVPGSVHTFRLTPDGTMSMLYASEGSVALYEMPMEQILGDTTLWSSRFHPDDVAEMQRKVAESGQRMSQFRWQGRFVFDEGQRVKWVRIVSMPELQEDGSTIWYGTMLDVTEEVEAQRQAQLLREEQSRQEALLRSIIDNLPVGVTVMDVTGQVLVSNRVSAQMFGQMDNNSELIPSDYSMFLPDRVTPYPPEQLPLMRALGGDTVEETDLFLRSSFRPEGFMLNVSATPMQREGAPLAAVMVMRDVTQERTLEEELRQRNRQLASNEEEKSQLVARLRYAIDELSNPILEVWDDVLAMPVIGVVDSRRTADMAQRLLAEVARTQAQNVIIDLTGVEVVDTKTADNLIKLVRKVELIGARCVLTGIRPSVAETVVEIGVEFAGLTTLRNLKHGLQEALGLGGRRRKRRRDDDDDDRAFDDDDGPRSRSR